MCPDDLIGKTITITITRPPLQWAPQAVLIGITKTVLDDGMSESEYTEYILYGFSGRISKREGAHI